LLERSVLDLCNAPSNVEIGYVCARLHTYRHRRRSAACICLYAGARRCVWREDIYIYIYIGTLVDNLPKIGMCLNSYCTQCINLILVKYIWIKSTTHELFNDTNFVRNGYVCTQLWALEECKKTACF
jgi:hypothetical protein